MIDFIIDTLLYSFAIFGIIIFFMRLINDLKYPKTNAKLILIYDGNPDNFEIVLRQISELINYKGIANDVYILFQNEDYTNTIKVLEKVANNNNISVICSSEELVDIVDNT